MLRVIKKPPSDEIYHLQLWVEHLVCEVWCNADKSKCVDKLDAGFKIVYNKYGWLKKSINTIYGKCRKLTNPEKDLIRNAFIISNNIEDLCNGVLTPIYLNVLPDLVEIDMKPLFVKMYEELLERKSVPGTKRKYYEAIQGQNNFANCPCCGYMPFENIYSAIREDLDHFLPKAHYPFASVNFNNLSPLCNKCNSDFKGETDPIEGGLLCFFPYQSEDTNIVINVELADDFLNYAQDVLVNDLKNNLENNLIQITVTGNHQNKIDRWNQLYNITNRYKDRAETFTYSVLRRLKTKKNRINSDYSAAINFDIEECQSDLYIHEHFIQIPFLNSLKPFLT